MLNKYYFFNDFLCLKDRIFIISLLNSFKEKDTKDIFITIKRSFHFQQIIELAPVYRDVASRDNFCNNNWIVIVIKNR